MFRQERFGKVTRFAAETKLYLAATFSLRLFATKFEG